MKIVLQLSPKYTNEKLKSGKIDDKIDVFEDQVRGYFLDPARRLASEPHSKWAALHLAIGYFERYAIYASGQDSKNSSRKFFKQAFLEVFPPQHWRPAGGSHPATPPSFAIALATLLYESVRCGLFHSADAGPSIWLGRASSAITPSVSRRTGEVSVVIIDPEKFLDEIDAHFSRYIAKLRAPNNTELRAKFEVAWKLKRPFAVLPVPPGPVP